MAMLNDNVAKTIDKLVYEAWQTPLELSPEIQFKKVGNLYERAKKDQWNVTEKYHYKKGENSESGFTKEAREAIARLYSQLYYGERGAQIISSQMVGMVPHNEAAKFLSTQSMDEARHVEIFEKMLLNFDRIYPMNPFLAVLLSDMCKAPTWQEKIIGMNMLVEGLALTVFHTMVHTFENHELFKDDPETQSVVEPLKYIIKDEARHVGFATVYLKETLKKGMSRFEVRRLHIRQLVWMFFLYGSVKYHQEEAEMVGVDYLSIVKKILIDHQARVEEMDVDALISAEQVEGMLPFLDKAFDVAMALPRRLLPGFFGNAAQKLAQAAA